METTINQRINDIIEYKKMSVREFERVCELSNGYVKTLGKSSPTLDKVEKIIYTFPDINKYWLLTGEGNMLEPNKVTDVGCPYYDVDFLGGFDLMANNQTNIPDGYISIPAYNTPGLIWCNITGHSMEPMINHGDIIALKELEDWHTYMPKGEVYGIVTTNGLRTVKIVRKGTDKNHVRLVPVNISEYDEEEIPITAIMRVFRIVGNLKRF